jgi:hypothetical protein
MTTVAEFKFKGVKERYLIDRQSRLRSEAEDRIEHGLSPALVETSTTANTSDDNNINMNSLDKHAVVVIEGVPCSEAESESSPMPPTMPLHRRRRGRKNTLAIVAVAVIACAVLIASVGYFVGTTISRRNSNAVALFESGVTQQATDESSSSGGSNMTSTSVVQLERPKDRAPEDDSSTTTQSLFDEASISSTNTNPTMSPTKGTIDVSSWINAFNTLSRGESDTYVPSTLSPSAVPSSTPSSALPTTSPTGWVDLFNSIEIEQIDTFYPSHSPSRYPTSPPVGSCFTNNTYNSIDADIELLKNEIDDDTSRSHFLGGIVRLVAHDFMDYDQNNFTYPMGTDGCFDPDHQANAGLPESVWCDTCTLKLLYESKYTHVSRADFWVAAANAVIRQTSIDSVLDLRDTFLWGRVDADSCVGSGDRLPIPGGCDEVEGVFLTRMGLGWRDVVALMGAHTLGRGEDEVRPEITT